MYIVHVQYRINSFHMKKSSYKFMIFILKFKWVGRTSDLIYLRYCFIEQLIYQCMYRNDEKTLKHVNSGNQPGLAGSCGVVEL